MWLRPDRAPRRGAAGDANKRLPSARSLVADVKLDVVDRRMREGLAFAGGQRDVCANLALRLALVAGAVADVQDVKGSQQRLHDPQVGHGVALVQRAAAQPQETHIVVGGLSIQLKGQVAGAVLTKVERLRVARRRVDVEWADVLLAGGATASIGRGHGQLDVVAEVRVKVQRVRLVGPDGVVREARWDRSQRLAGRDGLGDAGVRRVCACLGDGRGGSSADEAP